YAELRKQALAKNLGFSYLPTFAQPGAFYEPTNSFSVGTGADSEFVTNLADLYFAQGNADNGKPVRGCTSVVDSLTTTELVTVDGALSTVNKSVLECNKFTDLSAAMLGMHPDKVWLTRLELDLPKEALTTDCTVTPAESQKAISNQLVAAR